MDSETLAQLIEITGESFYEMLVSAPKSENYSIKYYAMELKKQRNFEKNARVFCNAWADLFVKRFIGNRKLYSNSNEKNKNI